MNYNLLLDLATDLGYELSMSGAETFRVEDSIQRVLSSYGVEADVFAIPNYLVVSIVTDSGKPITRMRRIGYHDNNLSTVERLNGLSRMICSCLPAPEEAMVWLDNIRSTQERYPVWSNLLGHFLGAGGYGMLFGCGWLDALCAGLCGVLIGIVNLWMKRLKVNPFFSTLACSFLMSVVAYSMANLGITSCTDGVIIGALMILVPGLLFTNAMRDIIYGDTNSGINRIVQVLLVAVALAMGTAVAWNLITTFCAEPVSAPAFRHSFPVLCAATIVGCIGFAIQFDIHGPGGLLCALGGMVAWAVYYLSVEFGCGEILGYFLAAVFSAAYAEIMARIRKFPAISYLVVSIFPLIPGAGVYYTMNYAVRGDMESFAAQGMFTAAIAGVMAVGILLVSTSVKIYTTARQLHRKNA